MLDSSKVMGKWGKAYLPTWLIALRYSSVTSWKTIVSNMIPVTHYGKSRLKKKQSENKKSWKRLVGGCTCGPSEWADPQQAPPFIDMRELSNFVYDWSFIILHKLKLVTTSLAAKERVKVENPDCGYSYYTKAEPACGFSGDKGKPQCTHALNQEDKN